MAGRTNPETGEVTGHIDFRFETTPMKTMNPDVIGTTYGELTVDLLKTLLRGDGAGDPQEFVAHAIKLADELVLQLDARAVKAKAYAESTRIVYPVDWAPGPEDEGNRSGQHWSQPEVDALVAQFKNGKTGAEMAVHHRRTWLAVTSQLAKFGLLNPSGNGFKHPDGRTWEL